MYRSILHISRFIFIVLSFLILSESVGQNLANSRRSSYYMYIYKLKTEDAKEYLKNPYKANRESYLTNLVDSFPMDSIGKSEPKLENGQYLYASIRDVDLYIEYKQLTKLRINIINNQRDLVLSPYNVDDEQVISDAKLSLGCKNIPYKPDLKAYVLYKKKKGGLLLIETKNDTAFYNITENYNYNYRSNVWDKFVRRIENRKRHREAGYNKLKKGYIAYSKPKYLPNDTLKLKAFLVSKRGKAYTKDVCIKIEDGGWRNNKVYKTQIISPISKGAYIYNLPLGDSLKLRRYFISIYDKKGKKLLKKESFRIEDYQLDDAFYKVRCDKEEYNYGDNVSLYLSGKNANGMSMMGSSASIVIATQTIDEYYDKSVFIPNTIWEKEISLDAIGETKVIIPDSLFPAVNARYRMKVKFNNSNNETHSDRVFFKYSGNNHWIESRIVNDSVYADYYENGANIKIYGNLHVSTKFDSKDSSEIIRFPYKAKINTRNNLYLFSKDNVSSTLEPLGIDSKLKCYYERTIDSIFISFDNPRKIPFKYTIYKKDNTILESGYTDKLYKAFKTKTNAPYFISYQYMWGGYIDEEEEYIAIYKKNLNVNIIQPAVILPGQETNVKVKITDIKNNNVENVNVLVGSVNTKFQTANIPSIPRWNKSYKLRKQYHDFKQNTSKVNVSINISSSHLSKFKLDTISYYNFIFPKDGFLLHYDSSREINNAQFTPHIYDNGSPISIHLIYIDDSLKYFSGSISYNYNSIILPEGKHNVRLRTYDKEYIINNIELIKGVKLDLAIDISNLPDNIIVNKKLNELDSIEKQDIANNMLIIDYAYTNNKIYFWQGDKVISPLIRSNKNVIIGPYNKNEVVNYAIQDEKQGAFTFMDNKKYMITRYMPKSLSYLYTYEKVKLNHYVNNLPIGLIQPKIEVELKKQKSIWDEFSYLTRISSGVYLDQGKLIYDYTGDSVVLFSVLMRLDSVQRNRYTKGVVNEIKHLDEGLYKLLLITPKGNYIVKDSVFIRGKGVNYKKIGDENLEIVDTLIQSSVISNSLLKKLEYIPYTSKDGLGVLSGRILDSEVFEPLPFANLIIEKYNKTIAGGSTDFDGKFTIKSIPAGFYDIKVTYVGYETLIINRVEIRNGNIRNFSLDLKPNHNSLEAVCVKTYVVPLIDRDQVSMGGMRGQRSGGTATYIDGVRVMGSSSLPQSAVEEVATIKLSLSENTETTDNIENNNQESSIRSNFKDYAYWQPNLITNSEGEVEFTAKFPDDITKWKNYAIAMSYNKYSGVSMSETKAVKMLMAELSGPRFLIEGDETNVIGKVSNYLDEGQFIKSKFTLNDNILATYDTTVTTSFVKSQQITAKEIDTLSFAYSFKRKDGYSDGELRKIPVFAKGMEETKGDFYALDKDTTINITVDKNAKVELSAQSSILETLYDDIKDVQNYKYLCMEQTASKLTAYLLEEQICKALDIKFTNKKQIKKLIKRLEKGQNDDGSWGWWPKSRTNMWMTTYIIKALSLAEENGYTIKSLTNSFQLITWELDRLSDNTLLYVLSTFTDIGFEINYSKYLDRIEIEEPTVYQQLTMLKIKQYINPKTSIESLIKDAKHTAMGNVYWGENNHRWYNNANANTLLAYNIIMKSDSLHPYLPLIRNYFIESKTSNSWSNTVDKSQVLATILPAIIKESGSDGKIISPKLSITGDYTAEVSKFPYTTTLPQGVENLQINKSGTGPIYFSSFSKKWNANPEVKNETFEINTWFELDGKPIDTLIAGKVVDLKVKINVKKKANYVMIDIPIPAGCSYDDNRRREAYWEVHRQYYKNRTNIFSENLNVGEYIISIKLQPRFSGAYTLNPAKAELMYFPVFYGNNGLKTTVIE